MPDVVVPEEAGALVPIRDGMAMTTDGWVVLGNGEALISPDDEVTAMASVPIDPGYSTAAGSREHRHRLGSVRLAAAQPARHPGR